jgi:hypothetical protein
VVTKFIISFGVRFGVFAVGRLVEAGGGGVLLVLWFALYWKAKALLYS